jgi:5-methylcytosine-specific restriction endonuclease McrA
MHNIPDRVFVLYSDKTPAMPCFRGRAWQLLKNKRAAVYRTVPFTIILKDRTHGDAQPVTLKFDPGSKQTGIAMTTDDTVIFAANLEHRGQQIKQSLDSRRAQRHNRRARKTRYRAARFNNRKKPDGWLPPSLTSRVDNVKSWANKLIQLAPVTSIEVETVRFDMQKIQNPEISGVEYQQGELLGYEIREYLLEKWNRKCAYCDKKHIPLEIEHVVPKAKGGSNRVSNLTLACHRCNQKKGQSDIETFVTNARRLKCILAHLKQPLRDAAAVNATRYAIGRVLKATNLPTTFWSGGRTKMNRIAQGYTKDHWIDATCVGESGATITIPTTVSALLIKAIGRGNRQMCLSNKYGFPRTRAKSVKRVDGFQTGDLVRLIQPKGKYQGTHIGTVAVRANKTFDLKNNGNAISANAKNFTLIQRTNGYAFAA